MGQTRIFTKLTLVLVFVAGCANDNLVDTPQDIPDQTNGRITVINNELTLAGGDDPHRPERPD